jgi:hypothetical protein
VDQQQQFLGCFRLVEGRLILCDIVRDSNCEDNNDSHAMEKDRVLALLKVRQLLQRA